MITSDANPSTTLLGRLRFRCDADSQKLLLTHGWEVPVTCETCLHRSLPVYEGWTSSHIMRFGKNATIYAKLHCRHCGADLKKVAGDELVSLFANQPVDPRARTILRGFVAGICLWLSIGFGIGILTGAWWLSQVVIFLPMAFLGPAIRSANARINAIRFVCECGKPDYKFMGFLGRTYCHRCSSCGKLLRLRD